MAAFQENPLGGILGARTASFYRLDATGTVPVEPVADIRPAFSPDRVVLDMVDSESLTRNYQVTTNALQDFTSATSNVHRDLIRISITGTLIGSIDLAFLGSVGLGGIPGFGGGLRSDLLKFANLEELADKREPVLVVTPRISLPRAFIESISRTWEPGNGENTIVTVSVVEARIVNPLTAFDSVPDVAGSFTGNNEISPQGAQAPAPVVTQQVTPPQVFGAAPNVVPIA